MKVVINKCYGGFGLSEEAYKYLGVERDGHGYAICKLDPAEGCRALDELSAARTNPKLVECVEKLGIKANGCFAKLKIVEIPDDVDWYIDEDEYGGLETVVEKHRTWD